MPNIYIYIFTCKKITDFDKYFYRDLSNSVQKKEISLISILFWRYIYFAHFFFLNIFFWTVTMVKVIMNALCVGKSPLYINGCYECCVDPAVILRCTITYIELTLYPETVRWLQELLRLYKTTDAHNSINYQFLTTYERFNIFISERVFIQRVRCCIWPIRKIKNSFWSHRKSLRFSIVEKN